MTAFFDNSILSDKNALLLDFLRQHRHGSVLCADVSADLDGTFVSFRHGHASEDRGAEGACERVACSHGVGNLNLGCGLVRHLAGSEHIAAVGSAGEHEHIEVILAQDEPALVLDVETVGERYRGSRTCR